MSNAPDERVAVISCIHGNLAALEAVVSDVRAQGIAEIVCLGDLVGYGPQPNEVVERVREHKIKTIQGCWDEGVARDKGHCGCSFLTEEEERLGNEAFAWTIDEVTSDTKAYLKELPFGMRMRSPMGDVALVHGSPKSTNEYLLHTTHELVLFERAAGADCTILVCGHTHVPFVRQVSGVLTVTAEASLDSPTFQPSSSPKRHIELRPKLIINVGSVGEPRHGGIESTYVILDRATSGVTIRQVPYDMEATARLMMKRDVPEVVLERFRAGQELVGKVKDITCAC